MAGLIGKKIGMTRIFDEKGVAVPVTVVEAGPCPVLQVKTPETDGYDAIQLGFGARKAKRAKKARLGHVAGAGPIYRLDGVRVSDSAGDLWDGGIDVPINLTEELITIDVAVYTGTDVDGFGAFAGITPVRLGDSSARLGDSGETDMDWVETGFFSSSAIGRAFYGISETLTVPPPPVPVSPVWGLWFLVGVVAGSAFVVLRRARAAGASQ